MPSPSSQGITLDGTLFRLPCACATLRRLSRIVTRVYDDEMRECGLEAPQFGLLATIARLGDVSHASLAEGLVMDGTTLTRTLGLMCRRGWLEKHAGTDRRSRVYRITPKGRRQVAAARPHWQRAQQKLQVMMGRQLDTIVAAAHSASVTLSGRGERTR